jgi:hypothetical protein
MERHSLNSKCWWPEGIDTEARTGSQTKARTDSLVRGDGRSGGGACWKRHSLDSMSFHAEAQPQFQCWWREGIDIGARTGSHTKARTDSLVRGDRRSGGGACWKRHSLDSMQRHSLNSMTFKCWWREGIDKGSRTGSHTKARTGFVLRSACDQLAEHVGLYQSQKDRLGPREIQLGVIKQGLSSSPNPLG